MTAGFSSRPSSPNLRCLPLMPLTPHCLHREARIDRYLVPNSHCSCDSLLNCDTKYFRHYIGISAVGKRCKLIHQAAWGRVGTGGMLRCPPSWYIGKLICYCSTTTCRWVRRLRRCGHRGDAQMHHGLQLVCLLGYNPTWDDIHGTRQTKPETTFLTTWALTHLLVVVQHPLLFSSFKFRFVSS